jgi:hypothetical protein
MSHGRHPKVPGGVETTRLFIYFNILDISGRRPARDDLSLKNPRKNEPTRTRRAGDPLADHRKRKESNFIMDEIKLVSEI